MTPARIFGASPEGFVVLVCGGRDYGDERHVMDALDRLHRARRITRLVHGGAPGADTLAGRWAREARVSCGVYRADWQTWGPGAGPRRNQFMLEAEGPDLVLAFPGGRGTADMVARARKAGVEVVEAVP